MKKIYRSIAVTVLAALMALPMVVRAEDKIVNTIYVTNNGSTALNRLYVGQSTADVLAEINKEIGTGKLKFEGEIPGKGLVDLKVTGVRLKANNGSSEPSEVRPFKKVDNGYIYDKGDKTTQLTGLELSFDFVDSDKGYKFDKPANMYIKEHTSKTDIAEAGASGEGRDGSIYFTFKNIKVYRKFTFVNDGDGTELKKKGETDFLPSREIELLLEENRSVESCLEKDGEPNGNAAVVVKLPVGATKYAVFLHDLEGNDKFVQNGTNIMTLGLDEASKAEGLKTTFKVRSDKNENRPYIETQDVTLNHDEKISATELIKRAVKKLTTDVFNNPDTVEVPELTKVKVFVPEEGGGEHEFTETDIAAAKALGAKGLKIEYRYILTPDPDGYVSAHARLFVESAVPKPQPAPQPEPKKQEDNTYFDLGRYNLPTCPDSKCPKAGTSAKKDDVPNTAAAANN